MTSGALQHGTVLPDDSAGPRILVVEDHQHTAYLLEFMLERAGFAVSVAADGNAALRAIAEDTPADLVLLDLMLPYASGFQVLRKLRGDKAWMGVPVIVVSGKVLEQDITRAFDTGADDYVAKPFKPGELLARIRHSLDIARRLKAGAS
ncbi:MAG: response regulator transcription factor [Pseudomonadota bacterium]